MAGQNLTHSAIAFQRLRNQGIVGTALEKPGDVVDGLVAVQAQDYAGAKWALGLRMQNATDSDIERALTEGTILRTHLLRPTWHFVTPADIGWLLALTAPRVHAINAHMYRKLELDAAVFEQSNAVLTKALCGGNHLTRNELQGRLENAGILTDGGLRLAYIMMQAELEGLVCSGPRRAKQFTYALLEERAPNIRILERQDALSELARRYFMSRGPATMQDMAKWSGLTIADARQGLEIVQAQFQQEKVNGQIYWFPAPSLVTCEGSPCAYLLSIYDEYISSYKDRGAIGEAEVGAMLRALGNALSYIVVVDGQIVGTWKRTLGTGVVILDIALFSQLTEAETQSIAMAAQRYGRFLGLPVAFSQSTFATP